MVIAPATSLEESDSQEVTSCPACGATESAQVGQEAPAFDTVAGDATFHQPAYAIRYCRVCALYFKSRTIRLERLGDLYSELDSATFEIDEQFPTDRLLRQELDRLPEHSKVLDFGCSTGRILKDLTGRFECVGVEPNDVAARTARERGIRIVSESALRAGETRDFDAIVLTDVFEHLARPVELIELLVSCLKPGGLFAIVTGNADAIHRRDRMGEFWYFRILEHLIMLSERHVSWLAERLDLTVQALHRCSHYTTPVMMRLHQGVQSFAYHQFRESPRGYAAAVLRWVPRLRRAEHWPCAPAVMYGSDHVLVIFRKRPHP